ERGLERQPSVAWRPRCTSSPTGSSSSGGDSRTLPAKSNNTRQPSSRSRRSGMSFLEWFLSFTLFALYIVCLFTVCMMTFTKGHTLLGIIGIFFPFLWLIGAVLPVRRGSRSYVDHVMCYQAPIAE